MSFWELSVVIIIGLLVIGPARLPEAIKTGYTWFARVKRAVNDAKTEFEQHIGADEIRRELHNEKILKSLSEPRITCLATSPCPRLGEECEG